MTELHFFYSAMNAGKSTALLQLAHNYEGNGLKVVIFTSAIDDRGGRGRVTSRLGINRPAHVFDAQTRFDLINLEQANCVMVDEAQFLSAKQVSQLHSIAWQSKIPILCFGLRTDFKGQPFDGSAALLALADNLQEIRSICRCSRKATMNLRINPEGIPETDGTQVEIGGENRYLSVCPGCYYAALGRQSGDRSKRT